MRRTRCAFASLALVVAAGCTTSVVEPTRREYRIQASVDPNSEAQQSPAIVARNGSLPRGWSLAGFVQDGEGEQQEGDEEEERAARLRARFGSDVLLRPGGKLTKQYLISSEAGAVLLGLLSEPGGAPAQARQTVAVGGPSESKSMLGRMLGENRVEVLFIENFETPEGVPIAQPVLNTAMTPTVSQAANHLVLVTAQPDGLASFEGALNLFFASIPQIEIEVKVVEFSTSDSLAIGVDQIDAQPTIENTSDKLVKNIISSFPLSPPLAGSTPISSRGLIDLGGTHNSWVLNAQLQLLESRGVVGRSQPAAKMVVRNGGTASVITRTDLPYPQAQIASSGQNITANIVFKPVGISDEHPTGDRRHRDRDPADLRQRLRGHQLRHSTRSRWRRRSSRAARC